MSESAVLALGAALGYGVADYLGGLYGRRWPILSVLLVSHTAGLVVLGAVVAVQSARPLPADLAWGTAAGLGSMMGGYFLLRGFSVGRFSVVSTVAALFAAALPLLVDVAAGARPAGPAWLGVGVGLLAIVLITTGDPGRPYGARSLEAGTGFATLSGVGYALMYLTLDQSGPDSGVWPAATREAAFVLVAGALAVRKPWRVRLPRGQLPGMAGIGIAAGLATASFVQATRTGFVGVAAVIASFSPAVTVLLAWGLLGERLTSRQLMGLAGAVAALILVGRS